MNKEEQRKLAEKLSAFSVFRSIIDSKVLENFIEYLKCDGDSISKAYLYGKFVNLLGEFDNDFSRFLTRAVFEDENYYIVSTAKKKKVDKTVQENATEELKIFTFLSTLTSNDLTKDCSFDGYIPKFTNKKIDFVKEYKKRLKNIEKFGYGIFASSEMFKVVNGDIIPVESADDIKIDGFVGYDEERKQVLDNTKALLEGRPAANVLLCGDAGTGKSSTVKACVNHFYKYGLRLIEIRKDQLLSLATVMGRIENNPLKFIIFIDDLSFNKNDDSFSMLKAALEGSASAKAENAVIYATSNRKHIIKESFADRNSTDDVHRNDTMQELLSLSDRFGLTVYFQKPNKELYLNIVKTLAKRNNIEVNDELLIKAEAFALNKGSRSPRAAEQFINSQL